MAVPVNIVNGSGVVARVTPNGELVTAAIAYDSVSSVEVNADDTAFNLVDPKANHDIVITGISLYANKGVGANDAAVRVYTANSPSSTTPIQSVYTTEIPKNSSQTFLPLRIRVGVGVWLNIDTDDDTIFATVTYHYIKVVLATNEYK